MRNKRWKLIFEIKQVNRVAWFLFLFLLVLTQLLAYRIYIVEKGIEERQAKDEALYIKNQLETAFNHSITATKMLSLLVEKNLINDNFDTVCADLMARNRYIDALQLVEDGIITQVYPLAGNEAAIGLNILKDSVHRPQALIAIQRQELYFEGPFTLRQGGRAIVGRLPVYIKNKFWGFIAVIIRFETMLNALGIDDDGRNDKFEYHLTKWMDGEELNSFFPNNTNYATGIYYKTEIPIGNWNIYVKNHTPRHLQVAIPISILGLALSVFLAYFISFLSAQPQKLQLLVDQKTKDLNELNEKLIKRAQQLNVSNKELEQFAYVASHDLQEPLRMVSSFLEQLEKKYTTQLDDRAKQYIYYAVDGAKRMRQIILDLLDFSRAGNKKSELVIPINLNELIDNCIAMHKSMVEEKKARFEIEPLPKIIFSKVHATQIFQNLINNALKYAHPERNPIIEIRAIDLGNEWQFEIEDNGIGIEEEYFEKVFIIFQRLHNREEFGGTGLGLAIVKKIIETAGGNIWISSAVGQGSIFHFTLPKLIHQEV